MTGGMRTAHRPALLLGKRARRPQDPFGFVLVVGVERAPVEELGRAAGQPRHHGEQQVLVSAAQQFVVCGYVAEHASRVLASVDGQQDLHRHLLRVGCAHRATTGDSAD
jgi:hypothetical protein